MLNPADDAFRAQLARSLPEQLFRPLTAAYLEEPRGRYTGQGGLLLAPETVEQVSRIVAACAEARVGVVPFGGGTGLVGGQILPEGPAPVILSLERMNRIRAVHPEENLMIAEAGAILHDVQTAAAEADRLFPLSLASEGSCRIGGNLATNAGGVNVLRYGNARDLCLGLEAVLPDGRIWNGLKRLRKDNTGYDLRNLLIGAEGSLGVITAATLRLFPRPIQEGTALFTVRDPGAALELLALALSLTGGGVSAFELIHREGLNFLTETMPEVRQPFAERPERPEWMVLVDLGLGQGTPPAELLEAIFERGLEAGLVSDGLIAQNESQRAAFWAVRESIPLANRRIGSISSHDISVPLDSIADFISEATEAMQALGPVRINCFGHLGDGNLHFNVFPPRGQSRADFEHLRGKVKRGVHDLAAAYGGSVSAEHGIGRLKVDDLERYGDPAKLAAMRAIKAALDPAGIMNPGAVLRG
ncbi:putative FAD-linked oxidoreductase [Pseudoruegeria aquimaris]|uniref:Putative FAD-linked oxidoreductase n=1 Tax=Pseudoruegeria aquimaris TaxID=393663 RepID=A0A1Y5T851_9RHOB|nr:FAD-binding oxidoreductase [Pseudoruegeria aquimaris]SLN57888.1 putative FAD-linked oxidoreductase [Pseudoruegeria aquimaris]